MRSRFLVLVLIAVAGCTSDTGNTPADMSTVFPPGPDMAGGPCTDGVQNNDETDVDCGGACGPCDTGKGCKLGKDCQSGSCTNRVCDAPSCTDAIKNGAETDVDCGGGTCPGCDNGKPCTDGTDCKSMTCKNAACAPSPCSNGVKDGMETDTDCGGPTCAKCKDGQMCSDGTDCVGAICNNAVCKSPINCMAGTANCDGNAANGCEVNTNTDAKNCGACGKVCPMNTPSCTNGACSLQQTMSWTDMDTMTCSGMIAATMQQIEKAMPQGPATIRIAAHQAKPIGGYGEWSAVFPNTTCVQKWLSAWTSLTFSNTPVCQAIDLGGLTHGFWVLDAGRGAPQILITDATGVYAEVALADRVGALCDLFSVNERPGFSANPTNTSNFGTNGDSITFGW